MAGFASGKDTKAAAAGGEAGLQKSRCSRRRSGLSKKPLQPEAKRAFKKAAAAGGEAGLQKSRCSRRRSGPSKKPLQSEAKRAFKKAAAAGGEAGLQKSRCSRSGLFKRDWVKEQF